MRGLGSVGAVSFQRRPVNWTAQKSSRGCLTQQKPGDATGGFVDGGAFLSTDGRC